MRIAIKAMFVIIVLNFTIILKAQHVPLQQDDLVHLLNQELSGESAKRNLEYISRLHRMRGSEDYNKAIAYLSKKLKDYNLEEIEVIKIPADGKTFYGTHKTRPAWNVKFAELWELTQQDGRWKQDIRVADYESIPMVVAQDSKSGEITADLIDIGKGTSEIDYADKDIEGKLVLTSSQPGSVAPLAILKHKAAGIISYAQNQPSAWHGEDENLIRWGHFNYFDGIESFAFMVSLKQARAFQKKLTDGETVKLYAKVITETRPTDWELLTAIIKGSDPDLSENEILFTCHLDHPRPGANDNASGCVAILEVARSLKKLIDENKISRPKRSLRFLWSPEIEGTKVLLNFKPEYANRTLTNIHMDMVGGGPETKGVYQVSRGPMSLPSFVNDVGESFAEFLNHSSVAYASGEDTEYPMVSKEGGREPLNAIIGNFSMGSDFEVFTEGSFQIPSIYLHQYPDRYIHTNYDSPSNIDPTVLKRSGFIGAASAYYLANLSKQEIPPLLTLVKQSVLRRAYEMVKFIEPLDSDEKDNATHHFWKSELKSFNSMHSYVEISREIKEEFQSYIKNLQSTIGKGKPKTNQDKLNAIIYSRKEGLKGGMLSFGYDYFQDHYGILKPRPKLFNFQALKGNGSEYTYETLNLVNGSHSINDIRNILSAEFGPIPIELVREYLLALESIDVIYAN